MLPTLAPLLILIYGGLGAVHGTLPLPHDESLAILALQASLNVARCALVAHATGEWELGALGVCLGSLTSILGFSLISLTGSRVHPRR